jgi:hypothetical protein
MPTGPVGELALLKGLILLDHGYPCARKKAQGWGTHAFLSDPKNGSMRAFGSVMR